MLLIPLGSHYIISQVDVFSLHNFKTMSVYLIDLCNKVMVLSLKKTLERGLLFTQVSLHIFWVRVLDPQFLRLS